MLLLLSTSRHIVTALSQAQWRCVQQLRVFFRLRTAALIIQKSFRQYRAYRRQQACKKA